MQCKWLHWIKKTLRAYKFTFQPLDGFFALSTHLYKLQLFNDITRKGSKRLVTWLHGERAAKLKKLENPYHISFGFAHCC
jgi:hypothetical protein